MAAHTFPPTLASDVLERLWSYAGGFRRLFRRSDRFRQGQIYLHGLLLDGERKSIEPLSHRVPGGDEQCLQQFINQSPWDPVPVLAAYRAKLAAALAEPDGVIVFDDTGFAKQGKHSVGVARQYSGTLGKIGNCQIAVSLHYATRTGDYPLALRLYLPETWTSDSARLEAAQVPEQERAFQPKWAIGLDLLDKVLKEGLPHAVVVADGGYGVVGEFRAGLEARGERYLVGLTGEEVVFARPPEWVAPAPKGSRGRPPTRAHLAEQAPRPVPVRVLAASLSRTRVTWRMGTKGALTADFAWVRVTPAHCWQQGVPRDAIPTPEQSDRWLLVEWRSDGTIKYALSNLPPDTTVQQAAGWWKERYQVEQGYRQLKRELGLDHFEGRSWRGFHHHAAMTFLAYGFLALEQKRASAEIPGAAERLTLGEVLHGAPVCPRCAVPYKSFSSPAPASPLGPTTVRSHITI